MALSVGKRKRPKREDKQLKYALKITDKVMDDQTLETLSSLANGRRFKSLDYAVSQGKEAVVFRATKLDGTSVAVKVFKFETTAFRNMIPYIEGDPRFNVDAVRHSKRSIVKVWTRKEYANLRKAYKAGIRVPKPFVFRENVIIMEFVGTGGVPYALLKDVVVEKPEVMWKELLSDVQKLYRAGIVHADLSPFNIIVEEKDGEQRPVLIDFAQGVSIRHPKALQFLEHDVLQLSRYFTKLGVDADYAKALEFVTREESV